MLKRTLFFIVCFCFLSCEKKSQIPQLSVYFWKTNFKLKNTETSFLKENEVKKIYVRYFDIGLKEQTPIPISPIEFKDKNYNNYQIIPVVYIKNEVFKIPINPQKLAEKTADYISQINKKHHISIKEIQIDCDWSLKTKKRYFEFINQLKTVSKAEISTTIRLHQVKFYRKTGIPPVKKGVLMYYNIGELTFEENSIYNSSVAQKYIKHLKNYPLFVDVAIPIFSWGVHSRNGKLINVIGSMRTADITKLPCKKIQENIYLLTDECVFNG